MRVDAYEKCTVAGGSGDSCLVFNRVDESTLCECPTADYPPSAIGAVGPVASNGTREAGIIEEDQISPLFALTEPVL